MRSIPVKQVCAYAAEDADITLQLEKKFMPMLKETGALKLFEEVEIVGFFISKEKYWHLDQW